MRYLALTPVGDKFVAYVEAEDFAGVLSLFSGLQEQFDLSFKRRLADSTGLDLNTPAIRPDAELLSSSSRSRQHQGGARSLLMGLVP